MPAMNTRMMLMCSQAIGKIESQRQAVPIWCTMFFAVFQATSFASAGSRFDPARKKRRVNVMNTKVSVTFQAVESHSTFLLQNR